MFTIGEQFEGYSIKEVLGESSLAITFLAESLGKEKLVLKVFKDEVFAQEEGLSYLERPREAITQGKIAKQAYLSSYKRVATAEVSQVGRRAYLVREYAEGNNLSEWRGSPRTWSEITDLLRKLCQGLDHLHKAELIHGGLCPQDIIIGDGTVKVTDFGTGVSFLSPLLHQGEITPEKRPFLPPWHNNPDKFQSPLTDIYALGALLYLLQKGTALEGIPEDASLPVKKALKGEYKDVEEFLEEVEDIEEEKEEKDEENNKQEERRGDRQGESEEEEGDGPVPIPKIEITGEGLDPEASGLAYRLEKRLRKNGDRFSFVLKNLEEDGREITVRLRVASGSDWIQVEPTEVKMPPGEKKFQIALGPVKTPGRMEGKIVLEVPLDEGGNQITRDILIKVEFKHGFLFWAAELIQAFIAGFRLQKIHIIVLTVIAVLILLLYIFSSRNGLEANLTADQTSGEVPLTVNFTVTTAATPETVNKYKWDFDGDGNIDETTSTNTVSHTYSQSGIFNANVKVIVDNKEYSNQNSMQINVKEVPPPPPSPIAKNTPSPGPPLEAEQHLQPPPSPPITRNTPLPEGPPLEAKQHLQQGMTYVSLAQINPATRSENYENALTEFSLAAKLYPKYAEAYSNRGVVYMQQENFNKALENLKKAAELKPCGPYVHYNLAALYSLQNELNLALDSLDKALECGFNKYDALRPSGDSDLNNLRQHPEFKRVLDKHKVFISME